MQAGFLVLLDVDVDRKMRIDVSHFVLVPLGNAGDEVVDNGLDRAEGCHIFPAAVVDLDSDNAFAGKGKADGKVGEVFCQLA